VLVRVDDDGALVIGQLSHSWLSGQIARAWGNERFFAPEPREEIVLGAEQHDVGWALFDLAPGWNAESGLPRSFLELTVEEHLAIWRDAPDRLLSESALAALVVSLHGRSLSELRAKARPEQAAAVQEHIEAEVERQARLCKALGLSAARAQLIQRQMWTWDGLSLALCHGWQPFTARDVPSVSGLLEIELLAAGEGAYTLDPWPFEDDRVELRCEGRRLQSRCGSEQAMREALAEARPLTLTFSLERFAG
jgi:Protein of unknown function (DUF3891)